MTSLPLMISTCLVTLLPWAAGYSTGPPIGTAYQLCQDMIPTGHGVAANTTTSPYKIVTPGNCYKPGQAVPVYIMLDGTIQPYFEGLMVQAHALSGGNLVRTTNVGSFSIGADTTDLNTSACFNNDNSAAHHIRKEHWECKKMDLTLSESGTVKVVATIVRRKVNFWVDIMSQELTSSATCTHDVSAIDCNVVALASSHEQTGTGGSDVTRPMIITSVLLVLASMLMK